MNKNKSPQATKINELVQNKIKFMINQEISEQSR